MQILKNSKELFRKFEIPKSLPGSKPRRLTCISLGKLNFGVKRESYVKDVYEKLAIFYSNNLLQKSDFISKI